MSSGADIVSGLIPKVAAKDVPEFLKPTVKKLNPQWVKGSQRAGRIAHVDVGKGKSNLYADRPEEITKGVQTHELTHIYQENLRRPMTRDTALYPNYDYGDWKGLLEAQRQGKTVRDFTNEQQAQMIADYTDLQRQLHSPEFQKSSSTDQAWYLNQWDQANQALAPYLRQLVGQPKLDDPKGDIFNLEKIDLKPPPPPGPPPATLTGTAVPLEEMGGTSVYANPPSPSARSEAANPKWWGSYLPKE